MSAAPVDSFSAAGPSRSDPEGAAGRCAARERPGAARGPSSRGETAPRAIPFEIAFLREAGVPEAVLRYAAAAARRQGVSADAQLLAERLVAEEIFYRALAERVGAAFLDADFELAPGALETARFGYARLTARRDGLRWLVAPGGAQILDLASAARAAKGRALFAVTTRSRFDAAVRRAEAARIAERARRGVETVDPDLCARGAAHWRRVAGASLMLALLAGGLLTSAVALSGVAVILLSAAFLAGVLLRLAACAASFEADAGPRGVWIDDAALPVYTVVVALYREAGVVRQLARAIDRFDYPRAKLDVKFVVEADDEATAAALQACPIRAPHEIVVAPESGPRTKPRALNMAMPLARGALVTVYDAEDLPDPRQLRRAAAAFVRLPPDVACLQASLVIDNGDANWMTAMFALDYAALFDVCNKGMARLGLPFFLGGTSNHFRLEALRAVGYWDAYNVTEDADLGLRLARAGYRLSVFESETFEEAPAAFGALVRQRTRWFKGWMQTALAHGRRPWRIFRDLGARGGVAVCAMLASGLLGPLLGPALTVRLAHDALFGALLAPRNGVEIAASTLCCFLAIAGPAALIWPLVAGAARRRGTAPLRALLFLPLWLAMLSLAAWRAVFELWRRPFHWEKTEHGLTRRGPAPAACVRVRRTAIV